MNEKVCARQGADFEQHPATRLNNPLKAERLDVEAPQEQVFILVDCPKLSNDRSQAGIGVELLRE
jgi:hypothetical protein